MATRKPAKRLPQRDAKSSVRRLIYETDTSGTTPTARRAPSASTTTPLDSFDDGEIQEIHPEPALERSPSESPDNVVFSWVKSNWGIVTSVLGTAFVAIVFFTRLDARVEVIVKDVDGMKSSLDKTITQQVKSSTQIDQLQTSVNRLEDQRINSKK